MQTDRSQFVRRSNLDETMHTPRVCASLARYFASDSIPISISSTAGRQLSHACRLRPSARNYNLLLQRYNATFTGSVTPLSEIWTRDLQRGYKMGLMPNEWSCFWHLADHEYCQGGGWICIDEANGRLLVIDPDLRTPIYLLNSSVGNFFTTLAYLLEWTSQTDGGPAEIRHLRDALLQQDCIPIEELVPFWMNIIDATLDSAPQTLSVCVSAQSV
ncbi:MAG: hypothetical protein JWM11_7451 [Planctomycetaceae bacterium]|nr:hypothetical protein [Planctomycetaceae bacterium]